MNNPRLATRYAKSIIDLAVEQNQLAAVYNDMKFILRICKTNPDFGALLRSPIIKPTTKGKIIESITKERVSALTSAFIKLLVAKTRELFLPEIANAVVDQYNVINNIHSVKITTAIQMSETLQAAILSKVKENTPLGSIDLETAVDEKLIGGFVLETAGKSIDTSILKDLKDIKKQFLNNDYLHKLR
ncbi:MAG: ATP synthase F1 subunit delta [Ferruginibacter sp.]|nr:ATP synthase F1 subunit delta [Ferruginibacter sp.]